MKKLLILLLISMGCIRLTDDRPFVVDEVADQTNYCQYVSNNHWTVIKADCGLYNIGDTIKLDRQ